MSLWQPDLLELMVEAILCRPDTLHDAPQLAVAYEDDKGSFGTMILYRVDCRSWLFQAIIDRRMIECLRYRRSLRIRGVRTELDSCIVNEDDNDSGCDGQANRQGKS